jgi:hypothetical protein
MVRREQNERVVHEALPPKGGEEASYLMVDVSDLAEIVFPRTSDLLLRQPVPVVAPGHMAQVGGQEIVRG